MKILVPINFTAASAKALELALAISRRENGEIILTHVMESAYDFFFQSGISFDSLLEEKAIMLEKIIEQHKASGVKLTYHLEKGNPAAQILQIVDLEEPSLVVMGTNLPHNSETGVMSPTVVEVIKQSNCPVVMIPKDANLSLITKLTLALESSNHEAKFIDWVVTTSKKWGLGLDFLHIQTSQDFQKTLTVQGLEKYLNKKYPALTAKIHTFFADSDNEGFEMYMEEHEDMVLMVFHKNRSIWEQLMQRNYFDLPKSYSHIPLMIMI